MAEKLIAKNVIVKSVIASIAIFALALFIMPQAASAYERQTISAQYIAELARSFVEARLAEEKADGDFTAELAALPAKAYVPQGNISYAVDLPYGVRYNTPTSVSVTIRVNGQFAHRSIVRIRVHQYKKIAVLNRAIEPKRIITADDVRLERMDVTRLGAGYSTNLNEFIGKQAARYLAAGAILKSSMVQKPIIIQAMMPVKIVSKRNGVEIAADGQALQSGKEGDLIRVRNTLTKKIIVARIIDSESVEVLN